MPLFEFTSPDGKTFRSEGETPEAAFQLVADTGDKDPPPRRIGIMPGLLSGSQSKGATFPTPRPEGVPAPSAVPLQGRIAAIEKALGRKLRPDLTEQQVASLEKNSAINFKSAGAGLGDAMRAGQGGSAFPTTELTNALRTAPASSIDKIRSAYDAIKQSNGGISTVYIGDLIKQSGLSPKEVHDAVLETAREGRASLNETSSINMTPEQRSGAITLEGERPFHTVTFK